MVENATQLLPEVGGTLLSTPDAPTAPAVDGTSHDGPSCLIVAAAEVQLVKPALVCDIEGIAQSRLVTVGVDALLAHVAALLSSTQISLVVVCDEAGVAVGVITETILVRHLGYGQADVFTTRAGDVMARNFTSCHADDSLPELLALMHERGLIHVPVVDENSRPTGVVNARDGLRALLAQGHYEESLLRNYVMGVGYQ